MSEAQAVAPVEVGVIRKKSRGMLADIAVRLVKQKPLGLAGAVIVRHALKNAFIPVLTIIGVMVPLLVSGTIIMEQIFVLPGVGLMTFEALNMRDYPVISGINLVVAILVLFVNLLVDLLYGWLDPRIKFR